MSKPKAKGTAAETAVVNYLRANGVACHRNPPQGSKDKGDIGGIPDTVIEVKNCARMELGKWVDEAVEESINADYAEVYAVVHKRRRRGNPGDWYCTLPFDVFVRLLKKAHKL